MRRALDGAVLLPLDSYDALMATHAFRFALGALARPLSGLWRVWTHEDDVHASVQTPRGELVLTAYPTGRWRITVGSDMSRWTRPKEFRPGWTRGPDLIIPYSASPVPFPATDPHATEPVAWLPPPVPGHLARFTLLFASPRAEESRWRPEDAPGTQSVAVLPLRTAGWLHLSRIDEPLPLAEPTDPLHPGSLTFDVVVSADEAGRPSLREAHAG
jgi:hypothetical protein